MVLFASRLAPIVADLQDHLWFKASGLALLGILLIVLLRIGRRVSQAADRYAAERSGGV
jgi:hypothetical protein